MLKFKHWIYISRGLDINLFFIKKYFVLRQGILWNFFWCLSKYLVTQIFKMQTSADIADKLCLQIRNFLNAQNRKCLHSLRIFIARELLVIGVKHLRAQRSPMWRKTHQTNIIYYYKFFIYFMLVRDICVIISNASQPYIICYRNLHAHSEWYGFVFSCQKMTDSFTLEC